MEYLKIYIKRYLFHCTYEKKLSPATIKAYKLDLHQFISMNITNEAIDIINKETIQQYIQSLYGKNLKETSIRRKIIVLRTFFSFLEVEREIAENPFHSLPLKLRIKRKLPEVMNLEEVKAMLNISRSEVEKRVNGNLSKVLPSNFSKVTEIQKLQNMVVLELLFSTAMRVGELCGLQHSNFDLVRDTIRVLGKGSKERMITIPNEDVKKLLVLYLKVKSQNGNLQMLFNNRLNRKMNPQSVRTLIKDYCKKGNITKHITPHTFRHTTATMLVENGTDITIVQSLLGHSSIATTQIYTHVSNSAQRKIITLNHPRNQM